VLTACGPQGGVSKEQVDALMAARHAQVSTESEEHVEASGFKFVNTGSDLYVYRDGQPVGTLYLTAGEVHPIEVLFLDESGNAIDMSAHEPGEYNARVDSSNRTVVKYVSTGDFTGELRAEDVGTAGMTVHLVHADHPDYSGTFNVEVTF
jgi:hypothetical protein